MKRLDSIDDLGDSWANVEIDATSDGLLYSHDPYQLFGEFFVQTTVFSADGSELSRNSDKLEEGSSATPNEVVTLDNGNHVALYTFGAGSFRPYVQVFDDKGNVLTNAMQVPGIGTSDGGNQVLYSISPSPNGGFVVFVGDDASNASESVVISPLEFGTQIRNTDTRVIEYNGDGNLLREPYIGHETSDPTSWTTGNYSNNGAVLENGDIVIAYLEPNYGTTNSPKQLSAGTGVGANIIRDGSVIADFAVHTSSKAEISNRINFVDNALGATVRGNAPSAVALDDGGFVVVYKTQFFTADPAEIFAQFYDASGELGALVQLSGQGSITAGMTLTKFETLSDGRVAVLTASSTNLTGREVFLNIFDETGVTESVKVTELSTVQNRLGYDDLDVGNDGSIYVTTDDGVAHRFVLSDELLTPNAANLVTGSKGSDVAFGSKAGETFRLGGGDDVAYGGRGMDRISGAAGQDHLEGGNSNDRLSGNNGNDMLLGGNGRDLIRGGNQDDTLIGGYGGDKVIGGKGADTLYGGKGHDALTGNQGADFLDGGEGDDTMSGGKGADTFVFTSGDDRINVFSDDVDSLLIATSLLNGMTGGRNIVREFAEVTAEGVLFDFGTHSLLITGVTDAGILNNDIDIF